MQIRQKHKSAEKLACDLAEVFADEITSFAGGFLLRDRSDRPERNGGSGKKMQRHS